MVTLSLTRCNLDRLKAFREPVPKVVLPKDYESMWPKIRKVIDGLHLKNHSREECKIKYNPELFAQAHPEVKHADTMAAEQQFSWLSKYRKQTNSMTKERQLFFLHRIVIRHNAYNAHQLKQGRKTMHIALRSSQQRAGI